ncbi:hypothetical protein ACHAW6_013083, partial [Cyclotella cf. meneghiniana]
MKKPTHKRPGLSTPLTGGTSIPPPTTTVHTATTSNPPTANASAGLLANVILEKCLNTHRYHQSKLVPGLWTHDWRPIQFTLVVDNFGIKYVGKEHPQHLLTVLQEHYKVATDWKGSRYIGIIMDWDYVKRRVHLSMPGYVDKALRQFQHSKPTAPQH